MVFNVKIQKKLFQLIVTWMSSDWINNNNNKAYTPLSERCSQSRVFVSQSHMNHIDNTVGII